MTNAVQFTCGNSWPNVFFDHHEAFCGKLAGNAHTFDIGGSLDTVSHCDSLRDPRSMPDVAFWYKVVILRAENSR